MIYFIGGMKHREFKYFDLMEKIRKKTPGIKESFFDADIKEEEKFLEKVSFNSIFSSKELIVLKRGEKLKDLEKILGYITSLDIPDKEIVIDYFKEDGKIGVKLSKKLEEIKKDNKMEVYLFLKEDDSEIKKYIREELEITEKDTGLLMEMIGKNPLKVKSETEKIKIFLNGEKFNINEVKKIISIEKEYKIYECTEKIFTDKSREVIKYLEKSKEYMGILYSLYSELEIIYKLSSFEKSGVKLSSSYNIFKGEFEKLKESFKTNNRFPNPYSIFKKFERLKNYSHKNLKKLVFRCWEIEKDIKTGKVGMEAGVEVLIMEIADSYGKK
ncbi:DNA polymerase III subunit delta [Leptotrichia sp. OH3620_COT-345]|uniref:DNA polymerase III subunit delta n=1 Tax=Leptotrichia sp. OH3620_COT-345 TaxID=2491048 RepID=UPI000F64D3D9|nr:DNA polymerase III subunit delta [Leptotrichia sp. OH3620_COT-345]RRD41059.1 DNA polymerase III subunit delta [Leptotrichia sp. OH3620_COT-345]